LSQDERKIKVALKYCGSCNPYVDSGRIARHLAKVVEARGDAELVPLSEDGIGVVVILCGCPRACGNKPEVRDRAERSLVVAGESLGGKAVQEVSIPAAVEQELIRILDS